MPLTEAGGRGQQAVFVTGIYAPLQKLFALRRGFRPDFSDNFYSFLSMDKII
ncbi:unknown protein [Microcystis aeruginosa NIES-843]|uniref:Uncharacterized protein n=1 Tax=Microcystis aeruginosa (strain NIES-843 / IAM M-2473) TaxID=449447 RepID=B0JM89_MICAN|nr:unknown protein [Microcystis aeruginosa NIES-843]